MTSTLEHSTHNRSTSSEAILRSAKAAAQKIPPLWPLQNFVAVNPFWSWIDQPFHSIPSVVSRLYHGPLFLPLHDYLELYDKGEITESDLKWALGKIREQGQTLPHLRTPHDLLEATRQRANSPYAESFQNRVWTVSDLIDQREKSRFSRIIIDEISKWCSAYFDEGQASWQMPFRNLGLLKAWKKSAVIDHSPELMGIDDFRQNIKSLPETPLEILEIIVHDLGVPERGLIDFFLRELITISGWAGLIRYRVREKELRGQQDERLLDLLAIRLAYDWALYKSKGDGLFRALWSSQRQAWLHDLQESSHEGTLQSLWQNAFDHHRQNALLYQLLVSNVDRRREVQSLSDSHHKSPEVQAFFCIDVRSEVFRRAIEHVNPAVETRGFAGFFGVPVAYSPAGNSRIRNQCPVLLVPPFQVKDEPVGKIDSKSFLRTSAAEKKRLTTIWKAFQNSSVSCFAFVETQGFFYAWKMLQKNFPDRFLRKDFFAQGKIQSRLECAAPGISLEGIPFKNQIEIAAGALKNMGLTKEFAPLVLLCGHGSDTVNNPYASGLDCGACGGHTGEVNARIAAKILNDPEVRKSLALQSIEIPVETWFIAGLHHTTTDEVSLFDLDQIPESHQSRIQSFKESLQKAGQEARRERSSKLDLKKNLNINQAILEKSLLWSEVRPEWGLAGNSAFIAAPRSVTQRIDLGGKCFLHHYDEKNDPDDRILEMIMTAPMVVAHWINMQYFASSSNPELFGSGDKVTHNVVGTLGVLQGNGGDLQVGLPFQSVHNGRRRMHDPLRLSVWIQADPEKITRLLQKQETVRNLVENQWLFLYAIRDQGRIYYQYEGRGQWKRK